MADQTILSCDDDGNFQGYIPKSVGHTGQGKRHFAITVLLYNSKGEVLIQKRKHKIFDNIWDMTASTHQLHKEDGTDETDEDATLRSLKVEYGIDQVKDLKKVGEFNYYAEYGEHCEHEHDILLTAEFNGEIKLNPETAYTYKWMDKKEFIEDVQKNPDSYTPWTIEGIKVLVNPK